MIFRKPQTIELPVLLLSVGCIFYIFFTIDLTKSGPESIPLYEVRFGLILTIFCLFGEMLLWKDLYRIGSLLAHFVALLAILLMLKGRYAIEEFMLVSLLVLQCSLRLSMKRGLALNFIVLVSITLIGGNYSALTT